jgi:hypothetical protein
LLNVRSSRSKLKIAIFKKNRRRFYCSSPSSLGTVQQRQYSRFSSKDTKNSSKKGMNRRIIGKKKDGGRTKRENQRQSETEGL